MEVVVAVVVAQPEAVVGEVVEAAEPEVAAVVAVAVVTDNCRRHSSRGAEPEVNRTKK